MLKCKEHLAPLLPLSKFQNPVEYVEWDFFFLSIYSVFYRLSSSTWPIVNASQATRHIVICMDR